ncbi:hypothetical protein KO361_02450 [Candidatus Woesearchaeota archaeon]|nr:hypothetical protein [Candidatus Woesearchaeota archaeon]
MFKFKKGVSHLKGVKVFLLLFIFISLLNSVFALEITDSRLVWNNKTLTYYSERAPIVVDLEVKVHADFLQGIVFDVSDLNDNIYTNSYVSQYGSWDISKASCEQREEYYNCLFRGLILEKSTHVSEVEIIAKRGDDVSSNIIPLKRTTANPKVNLIGTRFCHEEVCYISSGFNNIILKFESSEAGFFRGLLGFSLGGTRGYIIGCDFDNCNGTVNIVCEDNQAFRASLFPFEGRPSSDDAGRQVTHNNFNLVCDASPPEIKEIKVVDAREIGFTGVDDTFRISAKVYDAVSPVLDMLVIGESVGSANITGQCILRDGLFDCSAGVRSLVTTKGTYVVPVIFTDAAGNKVREDLEVELVEVEREIIPNFWSLGATVQSSNKMNVRNMGYERTFYVEAILSGVSGAELLSVKGNTGSCVPVIVNETGTRGDVTKFDVLNFDKDSKKVYVRVGLRQTGLDNPSNNRYSDIRELKHVCEFEILSKKDGYFYSQPEKVNLTFSITLDNRDTLTDKIYNSIESTREQIERSEEVFEGLDSSMDNAIRFCTMLTGIESVGGLLSSAGEVLEVVGLMMGQQNAGLGMIETGSSINLLKSDDKMVKNAAKFCNYLMCKGSFVSDIVGFDLVSGLDDFMNYLSVDADMVPQMLGRDSYSSFYDPYKSKYVAYAMQCVPAVIHHLKVEQSIECNYLDCLTTGMIEHGQSVSYCEAERSYSTCVYTATGVLDAIPFVNMFRDFSSRFSDVVNNPYNLFGFAFPIACSIMAQGNSVNNLLKGACLTNVFVQSLGTFISTLKSVVEQAKNINKVDPAPFCQVPLTQADRIIKSRLAIDQQVGHFPKAVDLSYSESLGGNKYLVYDEDDYQFQVVERITKKDEVTETVIGIVSPDNVRFDGDKIVVDSYNVYSPEGKLIGNFNQDSFARSNIRKYEVINNDLNRKTDKYLNLEKELESIRVEIEDLEKHPEIIGEENEHLADLIRLEESKQELEKELASVEKEISDLETQLSSHDINKFVGIFGNVESFNMVSEANQKKYEALIEKYPDLKKGLATEVKLLNDFYKTKAEHQENIDELNRVASGISIFESNKIIDKEVVNAARQEVIDSCESNEQSRSCRRAQEKHTAYSEALALCNSEPFNIDECSRSNINKESRDTAKLIKGAEKNLSRQQRNNAVDMKFEDHFGSITTGVKTAWGVSSGITAIRSLGSFFGGDDDESSSDFGRHTAMGQLSQWFADTGSGDWGFCSKSFRAVSPDTGGLLVKAGAAGHRPGAFITGRKSSIQRVPGEDSYYNYWVEGGIYTSKGGELGYNIYMYDSAGNKVDFTKLVIGSEEPMASSGVPENFGGMGSKIIRHEGDFVKVCLEFSVSVNGLRDYFDVVGDKNYICQKLVSE